MKITLIAMGQRMEPWVEEGFLFYQRRFSPSFSLALKEIPLLKRTPKSIISPILEEEGKMMLKAVPPSDSLVALDVKGTSLTSEKLAQKIQQFQDAGKNISLLIGSPEGMDPGCLAQAEQSWSLSPLTLPHPLVRLMVAEALYRSWCIMNNHPYHK